MSYGLWLSAAGMQANEYRQSLVANNMANVDTVGFKHDFAVFHERQMESAAKAAEGRWANPLLRDLTGGLWARPTYTSFAQGALDETGRDLDAALFGNGFFAVSDGQETRYTRDGRFVIADDGTLTLAAGDGKYAVLDAAGAPVTLDPAAGRINFGKNGTVTQDGEPVAQLGVVDFADHSLLRKTGESLFQDTGDQSAAPADAQVHGGYVERSTVDPINNLVSMIEVSRAYELNARMITMQDTMNGQAVARVGRIG